jgi:hypothetical protein
VDDVRAVHRERRVLRDAVRLTFLHRQIAYPYAPDCRPRAATHSGDECLPPYRWAPVLHRPVDAAAAALDGAGVGRRFPGRCRSCSRDHGWNRGV